MRNEIPSGSMVTVTTMRNGVMTLKKAEVLSHMDGVVHVNMDGEAVSVSPEHIIMEDPAVSTADDQNEILNRDDGTTPVISMDVTG